MKKFLTVLDVRKPEEGAKWELDNPLIFDSTRLGLVVVPEGFVTDFASVPRLPVAYVFFGDTVHAPAVVHDYLYSQLCFERVDCDAVFLEAMEDVGVSWWKRNLMWLGVRLMGWLYRGVL